ncbi:MAG: glucose-6-phosphate isomerase [Hyphomicrobiales bacterium]|nr:MAG: glucose-6-phosphate isomerase [Hyphomicrobiales bacterium]
MPRTVSSVLVDLATEWRALGDTSIAALFAADPDRFRRFSRISGEILLDFSKTKLTEKVFHLLLQLAEAGGLEKKRAAMFSGEKINSTEGRAVLHVALRNRSGRPVMVDGVDVMPDVIEVLDRVVAFADAVRSGEVAASNGERFTDVVNIGIGGSDLGPAMAATALSPYFGGGPRVHFVSNVDGAHIADTLAGLDPKTTLILVASKTFTTLETMTNARTARAWIADAVGEEALPAHFAAISTNIPAATGFGVPEDRIFGFWDWVGGRYSVWSAVGLSLAIAIGGESFLAFLDGAHAMDEHFRTAPLGDNLPVLLGLMGLWHRNVCGFATAAVVPYDQRLDKFVSHLQQVDMESNGKRVTLDGKPVAMATGPVVWGAPGTNAQHAFFQLLHQGHDIVPVEFLLAAVPHEDLTGHHANLVANCLAQSEALMMGRDETTVREKLAASGMAEAEINRLAAHKTFPGDRPTATLLYRKLDPYTLGALLALYEHRIFVQGAIWDINSFDQWGVELGKELAASLFDVVEGRAPADGHDGSTQGLVAYLHKMQGKE